MLTAYNGQTIDYDAIGNPTTYLGASLGWSNGRQLTSYTKGDNTSTYTYDADGLRVTKTVNGTKHTYLYVDGLLMYEKRGDKELYFWYDGNGHLAAIRYYYNTECDYVNLYALTNSMGDVLALYGGSGALLVTYEYDAWGNLVYMNDSTALGSGTVNPIRYRGYYYDTDTGLYYCQSRYYDPQVGRWLNADELVPTETSIIGSNVFAYYHNNPANIIATNISSSEQSVSPPKKIYYDVPLYDQGGYSLCWAFCQVMVEDFRAGRTRTNEQATERAISIARSVHGDDWNRGGWPTNSRVLSGINSLNELYNALVINGPIYAYYRGGGGAHLVVVTGVDRTKKTVYTNNPWGIAGEQTYSQFLQGFVGMPSDWDWQLGFYMFTP